MLSLRSAALPALSSQPTHLFQQHTVLYTQRRLVPGARQLLGEDRQDAAQVGQAVEQLLAVDHLGSGV